MGLSEHTVAYVHLGYHSFVLSEGVGRKGDITKALPPVARGASSIFSLCCVSRHRRDACMCDPTTPCCLSALRKISEVHQLPWQGFPLKSGALYKFTVSVFFSVWL